ncbi:2-hydroxychromene-2-carboxylate isomerase [Roseibium sp.]|uniref:2-hydroxychromene-2-carboxylate isomerase n=1 Tax=Roseibium sp. TaxID=1936156 RepID=UPI00261E7E5D|nr:2-hydroxychromene-2-carboxylate isomerase [Roseibium sp.]
MSEKPPQQTSSAFSSAPKHPVDRPVVEFWYEFASTYSYLSAMRIETLSRDYGVEISWRPFLLGPIFRKQGWETSLFNIHLEKGDFMWRDVERQCALYGLPFSMPVPFPQHSLRAARIAHSGRHETWIGAFTRAVYNAQFGQGLDISDEGMLANLLMDIGAPVKDILQAAQTPENKTSLRTTIENAEKRGIFGAPSFVLQNGELFWGNDRLEQALEAAAEAEKP